MRRRRGYVWSPDHGHQNYAIYPPGERCAAIPGSPVYQHWAIVWWYPGTTERVFCVQDEAEALEFVERAAGI